MVADPICSGPDCCQIPLELSFLSRASAHTVPLRSSGSTSTCVYSGALISAFNRRRAPHVCSCDISYHVHSSQALIRGLSLLLPTSATRMRCCGPSFSTERSKYCPMTMLSTTRSFLTLKAGEHPLYVSRSRLLVLYITSPMLRYFLPIRAHHAGQNRLLISRTCLACAHVYDNVYTRAYRLHYAYIMYPSIIHSIFFFFTC